MHTSEIFEWLSVKIDFIMEFPELVSKVEIYNNTEIHFGKKYYRIYFIINAHIPAIKKPADEMTSKDWTLTTFRHEKSHVHFQVDYFTEEVVKIHYQWISELTTKLIKNKYQELEIKGFKREEK